MFLVHVQLGLIRAHHRNRIPRITVAVLRFRLRADRPLTPVGRITDTGITATVWAVPYTAVYGSIRLYGLYRVCMDSGTVFGSKTTYEEALSDPGMSKELDRSKTHLERHFLAYYFPPIQCPASAHSPKNRKDPPRPAR